ncbi:hypothetical protein GOP47_0002812 [Adiantum capillus-veneris]|uniref:CS domain-containing protein n=1 Tax=Adiantum capillus-veneris TaxID=13818 RepID=A0A9D4VB17_ADICA|nr:hypothetical protein GOP47_0002812 [Adiantum capillus-veneris]
MPITPAYTWQESPTWVTIHVALRSISIANIDILTTDCYVKVNCHPYLFQVDLFGDIDSKKSSAVVDNGAVRFFLVKKQHCLWGRLQAVGEKKDIILKRERSIDLEREHSNKLKADAKVKVAQIGRLAVQSQMRLDEEKRKLVENRKAAALKLEQDTIQLWQTKLGCDTYSNSTNSVPKSLFLDPKCSFSPTHMNITMEKDNYTEGYNSLSNPELAVSKSNDTQNVRHELTQYSTVSGVANAILPAPRQNASVCVKFTPKSLSINLPARESRDKVKLKEKRVTTSDTVDISEREPLFLQDKGDEFYLRSNFSSAINAYTKAVQTDPSLFLCFANRAACFLQSKQFQPCIEDCTAALALLQEKKMEMSKEQQPIPDSSDVNNVSVVTGLEDSDGSQFKDFAQESLKLLQDFIHSKEKTMHGWYDLARRKILMRRGIALCNVEELAKAKKDIDEVSSY